jgi:hypothetical protein
VRRTLATWLSWIATPWVAVILSGLAAAALLLPRLGAPGLWEPQELGRADAALAQVTAAKQPAPLPSDADAKAAAARAVAEPCPRQPPRDARARTLTERALEWTMRDGQPSEVALRLPMALLGIVTVLGCAGPARGALVHAHPALVSAPGDASAPAHL